MNKLVIANWKMNGDLNKVNSDLSYYANHATTNKPNVVLALPYLYIVWARHILLNNSHIKIGAQDLSHYQDCGAYTGKINGSMLKDAGVEYVLIGHSERRTLLGENGAILVAKVKNALSSFLHPVLCVGEPLEHRQQGSFLAYIKDQLAGLASITDLSEIVIAYEPCWAIGSGKVPTLMQIEEVADFIHSYMQKMFPCAKIAVLYGGSVTSQNVAQILALNNINGVLVGGASLKPVDFTAICEYV